MYGFRLRFFLPPGISLEPAEFDLHLPGSPATLIVRQLPPALNAQPSDPRAIEIDADGFSSDDDARSFGYTLKRSLSLYSARHRLGLDLGKERRTSSMAGSLRRQLLAEQGVDYRPTVHGLDVFDSSVPVQRLVPSARASVDRRISNFATELASDFPCPELSPKLTLALELYNGVAHEMDPEVKFLALVTVVEAMAVRPPRDACAVLFIESCADQLKESGMPSSARESLRNGLLSLKSESISRACTDLVRAAGGDAAWFKRVYKARSELLHDGVSRTYPDIPTQPEPLDNLVQRVLLDQVRRALLGEGAPTPADESPLFDAVRARIQTRAYFFWENKTGSAWWDATSNWREAMQVECGKQEQTGQ